MNNKDLHTLLSHLQDARAQTPLHQQRLKAVLMSRHKQATERSTVGTFVTICKENLRMKFAHKPALIAAAVIGTIIISGTASAATIGWPNVMALFSGQKNLADGSRIVHVDTKQCRFITAFNITKPPTNDSTYYYRVKPDSKLTNEQLTSMVQAQCEIEAEARSNTAALRPIMDAPGFDKESLVGGYIDNTITEISPTSLAVSFKISDDKMQDTVTHQQKFTHIDPHVVVIDQGRRIQLSDLKVGDSIAFSYRATGDSLEHSETTPPWIYPNEASLAVITKNSVSLRESLLYRQHRNYDFEEVGPCSSDPSGYCTMAQLNQK